MPAIISESEWIATPLGEYVIAREQVLFDATVADIFGFKAMQLGLPSVDLLRNCRIPYRIAASPWGGALRCDFGQLPLATQSVDLLLLPHVLEFAENPHQILRDAERTLVPEGHIVISGFNPVSLWGARHLFCKRSGYPWGGRFISLMRIKDWLALLGMEVVAGRMACYAPPLKSKNWLARLDWMDRAGDRWWPMTGGTYFLVAKKRVAGMRLIRPQWNSRRMAQALIPRPTPTQREFQKKSHEQ
ncbi:MAG: methyltransferase type 11 [Methylophilales bacterium RIFCSPHIGHO2_02_FULL_57_10]|nr:MAG: methyltransferase type 11 [Methylophilales bacterium RIFCSPHIGHO2_02_FULL_57_10]